MKKLFWSISIIVIFSIIGLGTVNYINKYPTLFGNEVWEVRVFDSQYKLIGTWIIDPKTKWLNATDKETKKSIQDILQPFNDQSSDGDIKPGKPNYWFHIDTKKESGFDYLVWLKEGEPAGFIESYGTPKSIQDAENANWQQPYVITNTQRDQLLQFLELELTKSAR